LENISTGVFFTADDITTREIHNIIGIEQFVTKTVTMKTLSVFTWQTRHIDWPALCRKL